ncbi:nucleotide sugar dehydrogenase [Alkaliphilus transvaalensis]|uniref:nucleotide sugar dehydrogenase n=1 Tax=Alkaliphilus transvaalensis TaxID=114628 RepID=UPI00047BFE63|nr:nucleotide sugar dehydrogenase [Alkaliphilus transvaalensis]
MNRLKEKLLNKTAILGVIGLGYVGLPLAVEKAKAGYKTIGFERHQSKIDMINAGKNYIGDVIKEDLEEVVGNGLLSATLDIEEIKNVDCVCICVPTPLDRYQQPDISHVKKAAESIVPYMHKDMLIVLESTTYPGTTEELLKPILESSGLKCGEDFFLAFSPERVDPGNLTYKTRNTPKVVGGVTAACTEVAVTLYQNIIVAPVHQVSSPKVAEMEKILENTYRNINIGLVNELAILSNKMGINIWEVIEAAKTKPFGFHAFYPGSGLGGHCIPLDPYYLSWKAREFAFHTSMIESSMVVNDRMPEYCTERITKILNREKKSINGSKILFLGVAYKQDIDDYRESSAIKVIDHVLRVGGEVLYYDPYVEKFKDGNVEMIGEKDLTEELLKGVDLVVITTAHSNINYDFVQKHSKVIFDTKNAMKHVEDRVNIELL